MQRLTLDSDTQVQLWREPSSANLPSWWHSCPRWAYTGEDGGRSDYHDDIDDSDDGGNGDDGNDGEDGGDGGNGGDVHDEHEPTGYTLCGVMQISCACYTLH